MKNSLKDVNIKDKMGLLTKQRQNEIDFIIDDIASKTGVFYPKNSLLEIAEASKVKVYVTDLTEIGDNVCGAIMYDDPQTKKGASIFINKKMPGRRQRFTLAHELGHFFLHNGSVKLRIDDLDYSKDNHNEETEANYFAASLLMPKDILERKIDEGLNIEQLSEYFDVSEVAVRNRIKWIKNRKNR